ncbi:hypothetical protein NDA11_002345 [Ustilago hordei]|nr:hypothetical protein NDA11_002345 [Ustilago hordei]
MSPHDPNLFSLISSVFEPNFLILVSYLLVNVCLAFRVIRIATRRYRQLKLTPSESGEMDAVEQLVDADSGVMEAYESLFKHKKRRKNDRSATPVADALIRLAAWAAKTNAIRAKCILVLLAVVSVGLTWYYMLAFLRHSYLAYLERCHLTSYPLPPPPPPFSMKRLDQMIPALHLRLLRISQWLASLSLFKEAWMEVIKDNTSWWWSGEICIITVGAWALFLRREAERIRMPHVWMLMALGQLVAISFAFNLFNLGIIYRLDTKDLLASRCNQVHKSKHRVIEPYKEVDFQDSDSFSSDSGSSSASDPHAGHRPGYQVALRTCDIQRVDSRPPSPPRPPSSLPPTPSRSPDPDVPSVVTFSTSYIVKKTPLPPRPTMMDKVAIALAKVVPERFALPLFVVAGLSSVLQHPDSFGKVMVMHLFPLLISVYPTKYHLQPVVKGRVGGGRREEAEEEEEEEESMMYPEDTPGLSTWQVLRRMMGRSDDKVPLWEDVKMMYFALGVVSVILRFWVTIACLKEMDGDGGLLQRGWRTATLLFPTTFFRHPAQSSISSDHVCVAISAMFFVLIESGLWICKAAVATPSAYLAADNSDEEYDNFDNTHTKASPSTISLVDENSKLIETQARVVVALLLLSPLLGGSATMSFYLAMRCGWVQQCERHKERKDRELLTAPSGSRSRVVEEKEEVKFIENQKGERYVEVRKTKVEFSGIRTARVRPGRMPRAVMEEIERLEEVPVSSGSAESDVRVEGEGQGGKQTRARGARGARAGSAAGESERGVSSSLDEQQGAGRRTTPMRQRNPPQRYGDMMPSSSPVSSSWS